MWSYTLSRNCPACLRDTASRPTVCHSDRQALSEARFCRSASLATADVRLAIYVAYRTARRRLCTATHRQPNRMHGYCMRRVLPGTSARFWLGGSMPPCRLRRRKFWKFDYEMVHSEVYLNKCVVSIAPFSTSACPDCSQNITYT